MNNVRLPYAAKTLVKQVTAKYPKAKVQRGEPDGLSVVRTITFQGKAVSKWLHPLLEVLSDHRVRSANLSDDGSELEVTFVDDSRRADDRTPFDLDDAAVVLKGQSSAS